MQATDLRVDEYIKKSAPFAIPILEKIRAIVHEACPEVTETIKWSFPNFVYKGKILCSMAAFKQHCSFGFWLSSKIKDPENILCVTERNGMGNLGQLKSPADLPGTLHLKALIYDAMRLIENGETQEKKQVTTASKLVQIPAYFQNALQLNPAAEEHFNSFSFSNKKEYVQWIEEAKTNSTREKRIQTALEWLAEGKTRNWKYERK